MKWIALVLAVSACTAADGLSEVQQATGWNRTTVVAPNGTDRIGADGVKLGPDGRLCTGWEQGGAVTTEDDTGFTTAGANLGAEDCLIADVDGDGVLETVSASEGQQQIKITGGGWSLVLRNSAVPSMPKQRYLQLDYQGGTLYAGGKTGSTGVVGRLGYFTLSGNARLASSWTFHDLVPVGWTMALRAVDMDADGDLDIFYTDRGQPGGGVGECAQLAPGQYSCSVIIPITGDVSFGDVDDYDFDGDLDVAAGNRTGLWIHRNTGQGYVAGANLKPAGTGDVHGVLWCDHDLVTTYALTQPGDSWVGIVDSCTGGYTDVSGPADVVRKPDQPACLDGSVWVAEGGDKPNVANDLGVVRFDP